MNDPARVVVAMSGGVDSSVAAALLSQQGYQVIGMMLRLWSEVGRETENRCCTPDDMAQARRVAAILGIPFYAVDAQEIFRRSVVQYFIDGYTRGDTPNPCLVCNRIVRWEFLLERAFTLGAQFLATGHYARLARLESGEIQLRQAIDENKDQSYVLHVLGQEQLSHALFPLGEYTKSQVRQIARGWGLPVAERADSQDLCFIGDGDYRQFLLRQAPQVAAPGPILSTDGRQLGKHSGLAFYTIGQRKGIGVSASQPLYVIAKDAAHNALIVGTLEQLGGRELVAGPVNWVSGAVPAAPLRAEIKIRYKAPKARGTVTPLSDGLVRVHLDQPLRDITPGQAAVFYQGDVCLGGGVILSSESSNKEA